MGNRPHNALFSGVSLGNGSRDLAARYELTPAVSIRDDNDITWGDKTASLRSAFIAKLSVPYCQTWIKPISIRNKPGICGLMGLQTFPGNGLLTSLIEYTIFHCVQYM
jgi:hypothetical protein